MDNLKRIKGNFLNYDGIPWNNNNAKNAITPFANYRSRAKRIITKSES